MFPSSALSCGLGVQLHLGSFPASLQPEVSQGAGIGRRGAVEPKLRLCLHGSRTSVRRSSKKAFSSSCSDGHKRSSCGRSRRLNSSKTTPLTITDATAWLRPSVLVGKDEEHATTPAPATTLQHSTRAEHDKGISSLCPCCSRRRAVLLGLSLAGTVLPGTNASAVDSSGLPGQPGNCIAKAVLAAKESRPEWVDELYTWLIGCAGGSYEEIASTFKDQLLGIQLGQEIQTFGSQGRPMEILELGIGTGTNFKYYAKPEVKVIGLDPSRAAERYAMAAASLAGTEFKFLQGVGEGIPLESNSVDVVVSTLVLCSVADLSLTLSEVHRVLRPGGHYYLMEHVAAPDGTRLRSVQQFLDPLQQFVADGCHLTREPYPVLQKVGFTDFEVEHVMVKGLSLLSPHLIGRAAKAA